MVRIQRAATAFCLIAALAGCGTAAGAAQSFGDGELINDVASQLATADTIAYTAVFSLDNNATVSIAHAVSPTRTAYRYPGGVVLVTAAGMTVCTIAATTTCRADTTATPANGVPASVDAKIEKAGFVRPEVVIEMLTQMSLNADALISEQDTSIAGANATCVSISGVPEPDSFTTCVTSDGLLGSFNGTAGNSIIDINLASFTLTTTPDAFALPVGAKIVT